MGSPMYIEPWPTLMFAPSDTENVVRALFLLLSALGLDLWLAILCCRSISLGFLSLGLCWRSSISLGCSCSGCLRLGLLDRLRLGDGLDWRGAQRVGQVDRFGGLSCLSFFRLGLSGLGFLNSGGSWCLGWSRSFLLLVSSDSRSTSLGRLLIRIRNRFGGEVDSLASGLDIRPLAAVCLRKCGHNARKLSGKRGTGAHRMELLEGRRCNEQLHQAVHPSHESRDVDKVLVGKQLRISKRKDADGLLAGFLDIGVRTEEADAKVIVNLDHLVLVLAVLRDALCGGREVKLMNAELHQSGTPLDKPEIE